MIEKKKICFIRKLIKLLKTHFFHFSIYYFPKMKLDSIKISSKQFDELKSKINNYCDNIANEINAYKKDNRIIIEEGHTPLHNYVIVSEIGDYLGPVILMDGEYYRCIKKEAISKFVELWESGIVQVFALKGFVPKVEISEFYSDEWPIVLKQQKIDIKRIENTTIDESKKSLFFVSLLQMICKKLNCVLLDPHFYNYTVIGNSTVFYDLGSFYMTSDVYKYNDFSMVILGAYRILFAYFPESVLSKQELGVFREGEKKHKYTENLHEFIFYRRRGLKAIKKVCSKKVIRAYKNIFYSNICLPWDILVCFLPTYIDDPLSLIGIFNVDK